MSLEIEFTDNSEEFLKELERKIPVMLEAVGIMGGGFAQANITAAGRVDTGYYRNSMTYTVKDKEVYIGSNLEYAIYNEVGTGRYATDGKGRQGWWVYVADSMNMPNPNRNTTRKIYTEAEAKRIMAMLRAKGLNAHMTQGLKPTHALQKAASEHNAEYAAIIENICKA